MSATLTVALAEGKKHPGSPAVRVQQCGTDQRPAKFSRNTAWNAQFFPASSTDACKVRTRVRSHGSETLQKP